MACRAQVSLIFRDEDLYNNYIEELKRNRQLNDTIIKLLTAYFYREDVRALVDGESSLDTQEDYEVQENQTIIDNIRNTLALQDFMATDLQQTIENGTKDIKEILNGTEEFVHTTNMGETKSDDFGRGIPRISVKNRDEIASLKESSKEAKTKLGLGDDASLVNMILNIAKHIGMSTDELVNGTSEDSETSENMGESQNSVSSEPVSEVLLKEESKDSIIQQPQEEVKPAPPTEELKVDDFDIETDETSSNIEQGLINMESTASVNISAEEVELQAEESIQEDKVEPEQVEVEPESNDTIQTEQNSQPKATEDDFIDAILNDGDIDDINSLIENL